MLEFKGYTPKKLVFVVILGVFLFFAFAEYIFTKQPSFPSLPAGAYVGEINGLIPGKAVTMYAERLEGIDAVLLVIFLEGAKPGIHQLRLLGEDAEENAEKTGKWMPLTVELNGERQKISGAATGDSFAGHVYVGDEAKAVWNLHPVQTEALRRNAIPPESTFNLAHWLTKKGDFRILADEEVSLDRSITEMEEKVAKLESYVGEEQQLRVRSLQRKEELEKETESLRETRQKKLDELKGYVRELEQLNRITRRGQTIELARRVAKRENKWYLVNWQQGVDLSALEETIALQLNVDLRKLNVQVDRARELESLKNSVALERAKIKKLKKLYQDKLRPQQPPPVDDNGNEKNDSEKPWWKGWDSVFG